MSNIATCVYNALALIKLTKYRISFTTSHMRHSHVIYNAEFFEQYFEFFIEKCDTTIMDQNMLFYMRFIFDNSKNCERNSGLYIILVLRDYSLSYKYCDNVYHKIIIAVCITFSFHN